MTIGRHALPLLTLIACADAPTLATEDQGLACAVGTTTQEELSLATADATRLAAGENPINLWNLEIGGECTQGTVNGRYKSEVCFTASATLEDISRCLDDLTEWPSPEREAFCEALLANHDVVLCSDYDYTLDVQYRDETCKLQTRKARFRHKGCFRLSDDAAVAHPARCTVLLDARVANQKVGDVNNCPRCASCSTPSLEL